MSDDIFDRLDRDPATWQPEPGDRLVGRLVDVVELTSEYGSYPLLTIVTDDGTEHEFHAFHTVARNEIAKLGPCPGDTIGIRYIGPIEGKDYEGYRIVVERAHRDDDSPDPLPAAVGEPF